jgi:hypothetical protein
VTIRRLRELLKTLPPEAHVCGAVRDVISRDTKAEITHVREDEHGNIVLVLGPGCEEYDAPRTKPIGVPIAESSDRPREGV